MAIRYAVANEHTHKHYIGSQSVVSHTQAHTHTSFALVGVSAPTKGFHPDRNVNIHTRKMCEISLSANFLFMYPNEM